MLKGAFFVIIIPMVNKVNEAYKHNIVGIIIGPLLTVIEAIFDLMIPLFMKAIIDLCQYSEPINIPNAISSRFASFIRIFNYPISPTNDTLVGGAIILAMGIFGYAITMVAQFMAAKSATDVTKEVRDSLFNKILHLSKKDKEKIGEAKLLTIINSDTNQLQQAVLLFVRLIVRVPVILIGSLIFSYILDYRVGIAFTVIVPLIIIINAYILNKTSKKYILIQEKLDDINKNTLEVSKGSRVVRSSNSTSKEIDTFKNKTTNYQNETMKVNKINAFINPLTFALTSLVLVVIILLLQKDLFSSLGGSIASTIIAEMAFLSQIFFVTVQLTSATNDIAKGHVSKKRIDEVLSISTKEELSSSKEIETDSILSFKDVCFSFSNNEEYFFKDLSFDIKKNSSFGIIGGTGSGKSTLVNLIERFYEINKGNIYLEGKDIKSISKNDLRKDISLVNQKASLFKGSIKDNLLMGNPNASTDEMWDALKKAEAYEFVNKYEDKLEHLILEGGTNLSGGQKQRLCIARSLLKESKILILDDSTSALDLLTESKIRRALGEMDITKIIISQRVASIRNCNQIMVLDNGVIVGLGTHNELMKKCDIYKEIYNSQIEEENE